MLICDLYQQYLLDLEACKNENCYKIILIMPQFGCPRFTNPTRNPGLEIACYPISLYDSVTELQIQRKVSKLSSETKAFNVFLQLLGRLTVHPPVFIMPAAMHTCKHTKQAFTNVLSRLDRMTKGIIHPAALISNSWDLTAAVT